MLHLSPAFSAFTGVPPMAWITGAIVGVVVSVFWVVLEHRRAVMSPFTGFSLAGMASLVFVLSAMVGFGVVLTPAMISSLGEHQAAVASWLDEDYGIEVPAEVASDLLDGNERIVEYQGDDMVISLLPTVDGRIAVVSAGDHRVLRPKG